MMRKVKYISLINLIMDKEVVRELVGYSLNEKNLVKHLRDVLPGGEKRAMILNDYSVLKDKLGSSGASGRIALEIIRELADKTGNQRTK